VPARDEVVRVSGDLLQPHAATDQTAQRWTSLVASAAELGYAVHTGYTEDSRIDREDQTISISFQQTAEQRLLDLAMAVVELAVDRLPLATPPDGWMPQRRTDEDEIIRQSGHLPRELSDFTAPPLDGHVAGHLDLNALIDGDQPDEDPDPDDGETWDTPIFAAVARELAGRHRNGDHRDIHARGRSGATPDVPRRAIQEPAGTSDSAADAPPRTQRAGMAGARGPRAGLHAAGPASWGLSTTSDPLAAFRNRHNR
jgi:hypothetical protein